MRADPAQLPPPGNHPTCPSKRTSQTPPGGRGGPLLAEGQWTRTPCSPPGGEGKVATTSARSAEACCFTPGVSMVTCCGYEGISSSSSRMAASSSSWPLFRGNTRPAVFSSSGGVRWRLSGWGITPAGGRGGGLFVREHNMCLHTSHLFASLHPLRREPQSLPSTSRDTFALDDVPNKQMPHL